MLVEVTELMTELVLPLCDTDGIIGVEKLNEVTLWYLVPTMDSIGYSQLAPRTSFMDD